MRASSARFCTAPGFGPLAVWSFTIISYAAMDCGFSDERPLRGGGRAPRIATPHSPARQPQPCGLGVLFAGGLVERREIRGRGPGPASGGAVSTPAVSKTKARAGPGSRAGGRGAEALEQFLVGFDLLLIGRAATDGVFKVRLRERRSRRAPRAVRRARGENRGCPAAVLSPHCSSAAALSKSFCARRICAM